MFLNASSVAGGFIFLIFMGESLEGFFLFKMPWPLELPSICEIRNFHEVFSNESHFLSRFLDIILLRCFLFISKKQSLKRPCYCIYNHPSYVYLPKVNVCGCISSSTQWS